MKLKLIYKIFIAVTAVFLVFYVLLNKGGFSGYELTLVFFFLASIAAILKKDIDLHLLWLTLPFSILIVSLFFRTHLYPEIMILAMNRFYLIVFSFLPLKKIKIHPIVSIVYFNIILFFLFLEIILNIIYVIHPFEILKRKTDIFRLTPLSRFNNSEVNKEGYMGRSIKEEKLEKRILFIGDSFGVGVVDYKQNFIQMIEDSTDFECINLSQPGYSPVDYLREIKTNLKRAMADYAVVIIFAGNDVLNAVMPENNWSLENFKTFNLLRNSEAVLKTRGRTEKGRADLNMKKNEFLQIEKERMAVLDSIALNSEWRLFEDCIKEMKKAFDEEGVKSLFLIIPDEYSVNTVLQKELQESVGADWNYSIKRIENILSENEVEFINTTESLANSYAEGMNPYKENDTHINDAGNYLIYNELKKKIVLTLSKDVLK